MFSKFVGYNKSEDFSSKLITASKYNIKVYEGMMDAIHGGGHEITEIFIPSHNVCFNSEGHIFQSETPRNENTDFSGKTTVSKMTEVQLSKELVDKVVTIANLNAQIKKEKEALEAVQDYQEIFKKKSSQDVERERFGLNLDKQMLDMQDFYNKAKENPKSKSEKYYSDENDLFLSDNDSDSSDDMSFIDDADSDHENDKDYIRPMLSRK